MSLAKSVRDFRVPVFFEENRGQADAAARFIGRTASGTVLLTKNGAILCGRSKERIRLRFIGASDSKVLGEDATGGFANYYTSQDRARWITHIPLVSRVRYAGLYKGIDVAFHGNEDQLEYDFQVGPGGNPNDILFVIEGAKEMSISADGSLKITSNDETWRILRPNAYQDVSRRISVAAEFRVSEGNVISIETGTYDTTAPLTIDPVVVSARGPRSRRSG